MPQAIFVVGPPASGKSTFRKSNLAKVGTHIDISDIFVENFPQREDIQLEPRDFQILRSEIMNRVKNAYAQKSDIVIESTYGDEEAEIITGLIGMFTELGYGFKIDNVFCGFEEGVERDEKRAAEFEA